MSRYKPAHLKPKRPWEFSKRLATLAAVIATVSTAASYILAALGRETAGEVTTTVFTACIGYLITYAAKSTTEKISRNRHGLDEDGMPISETERKENENG